MKNTQQKFPTSSCSISQKKISKSDISGCKPVICTQLNYCQRSESTCTLAYSLAQAPCHLCLTTTLLATDGITREGSRFFTLVRPWKTSLSYVSFFVQTCYLLLHRKHLFYGKMTRITLAGRQATPYCCHLCFPFLAMWFKHENSDDRR